MDYEVEFLLNNVEYTAKFEENGNFIEIKQEIKKNDLPKEIKEYFTKLSLFDKLNEIEKITDKNEKTIFRIESSELIYVFDKSGKFIYQKIKSNEKEEEDTIDPVQN